MTRSTKSVMAIGPLTAGGVGAHWVEPRHDFPEPRRIVNATSTGIYTGPAWNIRPGAEAHKQFSSRGFGC